MTYCEFVNNLSKEDNNPNKDYHDNHYGFPIIDDNELFERLVLEINQAGLSWLTILKKQNNFREAYSYFDIKTVANYSDKDIERLLNDTGIIRNKLKINAAIHNAKVIVELQNEFGSFKNWIDTYHPKTKEEWVKIFKKTFKFTGGEIVNEFLMSTGYLAGAHDLNCPIHGKVLELKPAWNVKV
ncbi:DNA-3-methyladenine glycosylase I [Dysgonomonas sp. HDW5B]|uniref:DNA-3-methyladenine glycosylase I n=1 Tax=Dysgonomonas sp. HDW5B TaxID=2714927 RepID=UPI0014076E5B|nr:DNA-3-methyladenine glycosylase I [Dysgonomonas sp. HDW5B]QIK55754.1 DNA-3-methyladenine glycosylase I [Dysgonomonas sp. HDW5B]